MIQSALLETGILMASCATTKHWDDPTSGYIKYDPKEPDDSGHAFAIVGWTGDGHFIIQNSWGYDWGVGFGKHPAGFGFLHFYDWLQHGFDCYAIRLAAKTPFLINI
jgi:C1A family cysteine protease